jgi:hypothetical protein
MKKVYRDGRVRLTGDDYAKAKREKWEAQKKACAICGLFVPMAQAELDHIGGRGMGGSKRDDRPEFTRILHSYCHRLRHYRERDLAAKVSTAFDE